MAETNSISRNIYEIPQEGMMKVPGRIHHHGKEGESYFIELIWISSLLPDKHKVFKF